MSAFRRSSGAPSRGAAALLALFSIPLTASAGQRAGRVETRAAAAPVVSRKTPHLTFTARLSHAAIAAGTRMSIVVDVVPAKGMHVYAPGSDYRPVKIALAPHPWLKVQDTVYPRATLFEFKPLNEKVLVYDAPFRLSVDVTAGDAAGLPAPLRARPRLTIKGRLEYQACDDTVCYLPASVPFEWTVGIRL